MIRIGITGPNGIIGKKLISFFEQETDYQLVLFHRSGDFDSKHRKVFFKHYDELKVSDFKNIDVLVHLAGNAHNVSTNSEKNIKKYIDSNINFTKKVTKLCVQSNVKKIIFMSSVRVCKPLHGKIIEEVDCKEALNVYGLTKLKAERCIQAITKKSKINYIILRSSLVYGPNVKGNLAILVKMIRLGIMPPISKIDNSKSMIHIDDLVRSIGFFVHDENYRNQVFNLTDGTMYSISDIYRILMSANKKTIPKWTLPAFFLELLKFLSKDFYQKLFFDDAFSSEKLKKTGFKTHKKLSQINETDY